jgi:hypothetical protein
MDAGASAADGGRLRFDYVVDDLNKPKNNKISTTGTPVVKPRLSPESRGFGSPSTHVCRWKGKWHRSEPQDWPGQKLSCRKVFEDNARDSLGGVRTGCELGDGRTGKLSCKKVLGPVPEIL